MGVEIGGRKVSAQSYVAQHNIPHRFYHRFALEPIGLTHSGSDVGLNGRLECSVTNNLHIYAQLVEQTLEEEILAGQTSPIEGSLGVDEDLVGTRRKPIHTLSIGLAVCHHKLAAVALELVEQTPQLLNLGCSLNGAHTLLTDVDTLDVGVGLSTLQGLHNLQSSEALDNLERTARRTCHGGHTGRVVDALGQVDVEHTVGLNHHRLRRESRRKSSYQNHYGQQSHYQNGQQRRKKCLKKSFHTLCLFLFYVSPLPFGPCRGVKISLE